MPERSPQTMLAFVHIRRELAEKDELLGVILDDINQRIVRHGGIILASRQIITTAISKDWELETYFCDDNVSPFEHPIRTWGDAQRDYFSKLLGVSNPFQYASEASAYGTFCVSLRVPQAFLQPGERAVALVDATKDRRHYCCVCHYSEVVYTSAHRLVCMRCGQMHCVLAEPLSGVPSEGVTNEEWEASFDDEGELIDGTLNIPFVEYQDIFAARKLWETDAWEETSAEIEFLSRGDPEEVRRYLASQPTEEDLIAAGWCPMPEPPTLARQLRPDSFGPNAGENAGMAVDTGLVAYARSRTDGNQLKPAVLNLFQAIELVLKIKLDEVDPEASAFDLDNPTVLKQLGKHGVPIDTSAQEMIGALRRLRNQLQHEGASYGYRDTRQLLAQAIAFVDAFSLDHLEWWIGTPVCKAGWDAALLLPSVKANALRYVGRLLKSVPENEHYAIERCHTCKQDAVVREFGHLASCLYCKALPPLVELDEDE
jgi:hypothetical protein